MIEAATKATLSTEVWVSSFGVELARLAPGLSAAEILQASLMRAQAYAGAPVEQWPSPRMAAALWISELDRRLRVPPAPPKRRSLLANAVRFIVGGGRWTR